MNVKSQAAMAAGASNAQRHKLTAWAPPSTATFTRSPGLEMEDFIKISGDGEIPPDLAPAAREVNRRRAPRLAPRKTYLERLGLLLGAEPASHAIFHTNKKCAKTQDVHQATTGAHPFENADHQTPLQQQEFIMSGLKLL